ncbi:hypothetical protein ABGB14_42585 [Nonomuraea sp. B10E15]|uniref:hypothetical protein n=1 Tax=Nonomuraea sp. B10E15 TaxID=3153560 RepID=UPI00325F66C9
MDPSPVDPGLLGEHNIVVGGYWLGAHLRLPGSTAAEALAHLVARRTVGKVILRP